MQFVSARRELWLNDTWQVINLSRSRYWSSCICYSTPPIGKRVCMCVCLSVCDHIFGTTRLIFANFLCMLHMAVARSSSGSVVICYVLPVLWTTSYLLISQGCSTSPPSWSAVHTQPWAWLYTVCSNTSCMPTDAWDYFSGVLTVTSQLATPGVESQALTNAVLTVVVKILGLASRDLSENNTFEAKAKVSVVCGQ